jgi:CRISPR/Cas system-associated exonuclease Cas4 (RecB family)
MKISNSALDTYILCPRKFYYQYVERLKADVTKTPLLFGSAIDNALNYILESIRDKKEWTKEEAEHIFIQNMKAWGGLNKLEFFKNEVPNDLKDTIDPDDIGDQWKVWEHITERGLKCLDVYIKEVLPLIDQVLHVQHKFEVKNEEEDTFTGVIDFIAKLKDGRTVLFDNKTASAKYKKKAVVESQQLSFYMDQFPEITLAGYIVLIKNPEKEKGMTYQILIDEIPEETIAKSFDLLEKTLYNIKQEKFECNYKSCKAFGKVCEFEKLCSYGSYKGLIKNERKEEPPQKTKD